MSATTGHGAVRPEPPKEAFDHIHTFDILWRDLPEIERWKVAWGVWWRTFVASAILWIIAFVVFI